MILHSASRTERALLCFRTTANFMLRTSGTGHLECESPCGDGAVLS